MISAAQRNRIRTIAKKEFNIPKSTWVNVFPVTETQFMITYTTDRICYTEHREMLILEG